MSDALAAIKHSLWRSRSGTGPIVRWAGRPVARTQICPLFKKELPSVFRLSYYYSTNYHLPDYYQRLGNWCGYLQTEEICRLLSSDLSFIQISGAVHSVTDYFTVGTGSPILDVCRPGVPSRHCRLKSPLLIQIDIRCIGDLSR